MPCSGAMVRDTTALIASDPNLRRCGKDAIAKMTTRLAGMAPGAGAAMTEARHALDRRRTPRTCCPVADQLGEANCHPDAPSALGHMRQGEAVARRGRAARRRA